MKQPGYPIPAKMPYIEKNGTFQQRCNWTAVAKEQVQMAKRALRSTGSDTRFDFSDAMLKRRIRAVADYADLIIERYRDVPGYEPDRKDETGASWIFMNFAPSSTYNHIEKQMDLLFAASIWILDEILLPGDLEKRKELFRILPKEDSDIDDLLNFPDCWHACYEDTLILSVMYVLYYRNRDIAPMEMDDGETERVITSSIHAKGEQHADVPSRQAFDAMMALIPEESIRRAAAYFEELFWMWTDRYFECILPLDAAIRASRDRANGIADEFNRLRLEIRDDLDAMMKAKEKKNLQAKRPVYNPLLVNPEPLSGNPFDRFMAGNAPANAGFGGSGVMDDIDRIMEKTERLDDLTDRFEAEMGKYEDLETGKRMFAMQVQRMGCIQQEDCVKDYGEEVAERMKPLRILNPYEACFGLLWLIESGSDLPWLYGSGCGLMNEVSEALPWGVFGYKSWQDPVWEPDDEEYAENLRLAAEKPSSIPEWYERSYVPKNGELFSFHRSMAQILYEETGCIMPRNIRKYDGQQKLFRKYGVPAKEMNALLLLCTALSHARRGAHALNFDGDVLQFWDEQDRKDEAGGRKKKKQPVSRPLTREELEEQLKLSQEENKKLRSSLHEAERSSRESRKELLSARNEAELDRRELADLRELIFILDHEGEEKETPETVDESSFPYEVRKETVVFGGHDSWLKAIRPMLTGNIRFMDREVFNASVIRNADVIWIQPNALSHSQYYRIVDAARQDRKPVRYFTYASAAKGAAQLMQSDMALVRRDGSS